MPQAAIYVAPSFLSFLHQNHGSTLRNHHLLTAPSNMAADPSTKIKTYHCICAQLSCALFGTLAYCPKRSKDGAAICPLIPNNATTLSSSPEPSSLILSPDTSTDSEPVVVKLEDGFEKRYFVKCGRCGLRVGYFLDGASFGEGKEVGKKGDVVYLLDGALTGTDEVRDLGKQMGRAVEAVG